MGFDTTFGESPQSGVMQPAVMPQPDVAQPAVMPQPRAARDRVAQAPVVLVLGAISVAATGWAPELIPLLALAVASAELASVDLRSHRLPNTIVVPLIGIGLATAPISWSATGRTPWAPLLAAAAYAGILFLFSLAGGVGMGDVKLAIALGLASWLPFVGLLSPVLACLGGGIASTILLARRQRGRRIAFGPFLLAGFWAAVALVAVARLA